MSARICCVLIPLIAVASFVEVALAGDPAEERAVLKLLDRVMKGNPSPDFQKEAQKLLGLQAVAGETVGQLKEENQYLQELWLGKSKQCDALAIANQTLNAQLRKLGPGPDPDGGRFAVDQIQGRLVIDNDCPHSVSFIIKDENGPKPLITLYTGRGYKIPVTVKKVGGEVEVELVGHERPKKWRVVGPDYAARIQVMPKYLHAAGPNRVQRHTVYRPVMDTSGPSK